MVELPLLSGTRIGIWPPARKLALTPDSVVRLGSASVRTRFLLSSALIVALRSRPELAAITPVTNSEKESAFGLPTATLVPPLDSPAQLIPSSRPASRCASRMRTSRLTCWPPTSVIVLITAGLPYWSTMVSTFCIESASVTVPLRRTRPLTVPTFTLDVGTAAWIEREISAVSAPTSTAKRPTGAPAEE